MKPMHRSKPQPFPGWLCAALVIAGLLAMLTAVIILPGCAGLDRATDTFNRGNAPATQPDTPAIAATRVGISIIESFPFGDAAIQLTAAAAAVYGAFRVGKRRGWLALWPNFKRVVETVDPLMPRDDVGRAQLQAAQGDVTTKLVKAAKSERA